MNRWRISQKAEFQGDEGRRVHMGDIDAETEEEALREADRKFGEGVDRKAVKLPGSIA